MSAVKNAFHDDIAYRSTLHDDHAEAVALTIDGLKGLVTYLRARDMDESAALVACAAEILESHEREIDTAWKAYFGAIDRAMDNRAEANRLRSALKALHLQALQSNVNDPANEWGRAALERADAVLRDTDGSGEAGETAKTGSTRRATAGAEGIAHPSHPPSGNPHDPI